MAKRLDIDACIGSQVRDTQGETLSVEGADISDLESGKGRFNDNHARGFSNTLGRVTAAKKIFKKEDCEDERQLYYWEKVKSPFIYAKGYLFNDEDHENAKATAAILKNIYKEDAPLKVKASVEGGVISRGIKDPTLLARTKIHSVALTFTPANQATLVEPLNLEKSDYEPLSDDLIKSLMPLIKDAPSFIDISDSMRMIKISDNVSKINALVKQLKPKTEQLATSAAAIPKMGETFKLKSEKPEEKSIYTPKRGRSYDEAQREKRQQAFITGKKQLYAQPVTNVTDNKLNQDVIRQTPIKEWSEDIPFKIHAAKMHHTPGYEKDLRANLTQRGLSNEHIDALVNKIRTYMPKQTVIKKSDDIEKGEIANTLRNIALVSALATGAQYFDADSNKDGKEPKVTIEQSASPEFCKPPGCRPDISSEPKITFGAGATQEDREKAKKMVASIKQKQLNKSLDAGYNGDAPTSFTGGSVLQSESHDGLRTITCDQCGKEQVYFKNQVKCRDCGKSFSMKRIFSMV